MRAARLSRRLRGQHRALAQPPRGRRQRRVGEDLLDAVEGLQRVADALIEHHLAVELLGELVEVAGDLLGVAALREALEVLGAVGELPVAARELGEAGAGVCLLYTSPSPRDS